MEQLRVVTVTRDDIVWPFRGDPFMPLGPKRGRRSVSVDPTPAYPHDASLVSEMLERVARTFSVPWPVTVYCLPVEEVGRSNGATLVDTDYSQPPDEQGRYRGVAVRIYLSAKRIPIHPAMTRYLVVHEYGHVVEEVINHRRGGPLNGDAVGVEYAALRGLAVPDDVGGGVWHRSPAEVLADDFRLYVCGTEPEYWPHPGIERPEFLSAVRDWWDAELSWQPSASEQEAPNAAA